MKLQAETQGNKYEIEILRDGSRLSTSIDGRNYELEASEPEPGTYLFKKDSRIFVAVVSTSVNAADLSLVTINGQTHEIRVIDPKRLRGKKGDDVDASGKAEIKTAMPGKVVRIMVSVGDPVQKGDGVIVVEAMKMQNEMKSTKNGVIVEIKAAEGDTVGAGDILVVIE